MTCFDQEYKVLLGLEIETTILQSAVQHPNHLTHIPPQTIFTLQCVCLHSFLNLFTVFLCPFSVCGHWLAKTSWPMKDISTGKTSDCNRELWSKNSIINFEKKKFCCCYIIVIIVVIFILYLFFCWWKWLDWPWLV